jgi:hypothetical protein
MIHPLYLWVIIDHRKNVHVIYKRNFSNVFYNFFLTQLLNIFSQNKLALYENIFLVYSTCPLVYVVKEKYT